MKRFSLPLLIALFVSLFLCMTAAEEAPALIDSGLDLPGISVHYPKYSGSQAEAVNRAITEGCGVGQYLDRAALLIGTKTPMTVVWSAADDKLTGDVASVLMTAQGPLEDTRSTFRYTAVTVDLTDGHAVTMDELFTDAAQARQMLETLIDETVLPEMSAHLSARDAVPLPDNFTIDAGGITLYYPIERLSTLTDKAGSIRISWHHLLPVINLEKGSILSRIGAADMLSLNAERIAAMTEAGHIPFTPATLGEDIKPLTDAAGLLYDPDLTRDNRLFMPEGAAFRSVYLLSDSLLDGWDNSVVQGIRTDDVCVWGLKTGITTMADWRASLGEPEHTLVLDAENADALRLVPGTTDYYRFGQHQLRLHADENGVLASLILME